jgi:hypothetical protein
MAHFAGSSPSTGRLYFMAKALIGHLNSDLRDPRLAVENARLRNRVAELESLVLRLSEENDELMSARAAELLTETEQEAQAAAIAAMSFRRLRNTSIAVLSAESRLRVDGREQCEDLLPECFC